MKIDDCLSENYDGVALDVPTELRLSSNDFIVEYARNHFFSCYKISISIKKIKTRIFNLF